MGRLGGKWGGGGGRTWIEGGSFRLPRIQAAREEKKGSEDTHTITRSKTPEVMFTAAASASVCIRTAEETTEEDGSVGTAFGDYFFFLCVWFHVTLCHTRRRTLLYMR